MYECLIIRLEQKPLEPSGINPASKLEVIVSVGEAGA